MRENFHVGSKPPEQYVIQFESLLVDETGQEAWNTGEFVFSEKGLAYKQILRLLGLEEEGGIVREITLLTRTTEAWIV